MRLRFDSLVPDVRPLPPILVILSRTMTSDSPSKASDDKFLTLTSYEYGYAWWLRQSLVILLLLQGPSPHTSAGSLRLQK